MSQRTSLQHVKSDIGTLIRHRRGKRRTTNSNREKLMMRIAEKVLRKFHTRPKAWELEHMLWLWEEIENTYSATTAYVYKTVAREIAEYYGQWSYVAPYLDITSPKQSTAVSLLETSCPEAPDTTREGP